MYRYYKEITNNDFENTFFISENVDRRQNYAASFRASSFAVPLVLALDRRGMGRWMDAGTSTLCSLS